MATSYISAGSVASNPIIVSGTSGSVGLTAPDGWLLVLFAEYNLVGGNSVALSDDTGQTNNYTLVSTDSDGALIQTSVWYVNNCKGFAGGKNVTLTLTHAVNAALIIHAYPYGDWLFDGYAFAVTSATTNGVPFSSGNYTPTANGCIRIGFAAAHNSVGDNVPTGTISAGSGYTGVVGTGSPVTACSEDAYLSSATSTSATFVSSADGDKTSVYLVVFRPKGWVQGSVTDLSDMHTGGTTNVTLTPQQGAIRPGSSAFVMFGWDDGVVDTVTVTDNASGSPNTYTVITPVSFSGEAAGMAYCTNVLGSPTTITVTTNASHNTIIGYVEEYSVHLDSAHVQSSHATSSSSGSFQVASSMTSIRNALSYAMVWLEGAQNATAGSGFFARGNKNSIIVTEDKFISSNTSVQPAIVNGGASAAILFGLVIDFVATAATLYITELRAMAPGSPVSIPIPQMPEVATQQLTIGSSTTPSAAFNNATRFIRVHTDAICSIEIATSPTAVATKNRIAADQTEYFSVRPGDKIAVITNT